MQVDCPKCTASAGRHCHNGWGHSLPIHVDRLEAGRIKYGLPPVEKRIRKRVRHRRPHQ